MKKSLVNLAKSNPTPAINKKTSEPKKIVVVEKSLTPEEERDLKAKQKVEELLQDVDTALTLNNGGASVVAINEPDNTKDVTGIEWLQEQVAALSEETEQLRGELAQSRDDYTRIFDQYHNQDSSMLNETTKQNVLIMFHELQNNFIGNNPERTAWREAQIEYLLKQMISLFPFTENYRRF